MSPEEWLASQTKQSAPAAPTPAASAAAPVAAPMSPEQWAASQPKPMGFLESISESITGRQRATPETQALPEWVNMPELNQLSVAGFKTALGTLMSDPKETVQVLQANFPGVQVRQDAKGNYLLRSSVDQQEYAITPGLTFGDIPRIGSALAAFTPAGRAATIPSAIMRSAGTQAIIEASQAATGGEFNKGEVVTAAVTGPAGQILQRTVPPVVQAVKKGIQRVTGKAPAPAAPMGTAIAPEAPPITPAAAVIPETVPVVNETSTYLMAESPAGKVGGVKLPDGIKINYAEVEEAFRGKGEGLKLYQRLIDSTLEKGQNVYSDFTVEGPAVKIYDALERRGYKIEKNIAGTLDDGSVYGPGATQSAFKIVGKPPAAPIVAEATQEEVGKLVKQASGTGFGSAGARDRLADLAQVNVTAKEAADRLGIQLPADVFSDNPQVRAAAGLTRSAAGSEAEAAWRNTVTQAVDKADDVIKQFDATFVEGAVAPGVVSQKIKDSLIQQQKTTSQEAKVLYEAVDLKVPEQTLVTFPALKAKLAEIATRLGEEGVEKNSTLKMFNKMVSDADAGKVPYGRLKEEKTLIGDSIKFGQNDYSKSISQGRLKEIYGALAKDQLDNVEKLADAEVRQQLRSANLLTAKEKAIGQRIINAFGQDIEGSLGSKLRSAIISGGKGDTGDFNRLLKIVPEEFRKETVATALAAATRSARGAEKGGFGFSEFADLYPKLRANPPVYKTIVDTLGKDSTDVLRDLYVVSKRVTEARANVLTTGKANQALLQGMQAESLIGKVMESTLAKGALTGAAAMGGPIAAAATSVITGAMTQGNKDSLKAAGKLFADEGFQKLAVEAATTGTPSTATIRRAAMSEAFQNFADAAKLPKALDARIQWLQTATQAERQFDEENQ